MSSTKPANASGDAGLMPRSEAYSNAALESDNLKLRSRLRDMEEDYERLKVVYSKQSMEMEEYVQFTAAQMNSKEMEKRCDSMMKLLWGAPTTDTLFQKAKEVIDKVSNCDLRRDTIRTKETTDSIIGVLKT